MQAKLQEWIYEREVFAGIECVQREGQLYYHLCVLKKEKNSAKIIQQKQGITALSALKEYLEDDMPIFLGLNIKGILNRALDYKPTTEEEALSAVFPSAKATDFQVQQIEVQQQTFVSVIRKDKVLELLKDFDAAGLWVVNVFIGPFWIEEILPILPAYVSQIQTAQELLQIEEQHICSFSKQAAMPSTSFVVGDDRVEEENLLALSMAFLALTQPTIQGLTIEEVQIKKEAFYYKKLFHYTLLLALGTFFFALLVNYLLFEHYNTKQQQLKIETTQQQNLLNQRDSLAEKYQSKKALLGDQLSLGRSKSSFYADQLAATLPSTLQLTKLVLFPVIKEERYTSEEELPRYDRQTIRIEGQCKASVFYNNWKRALEELDWVASIHNLSYQNGENGQGIFELEITLNHD
ncbi:hypothetical protein [Aureispira anguillae]|uniref:Uncharacterized protein n=1 Tax=Aureispira anguillae TaxID=2864201 RepID=A0A916DUP6_9BACT|nr:hypothetical protein [Aureispira anguillae]BDS14304.1 hypothetical protein AsAng_0050830 [Aureispira anguillae]